MRLDMSEKDIKRAIIQAIEELNEGYYCKVCRRKHFKGKPYYNAHLDYIDVDLILKEDNVKMKTQEILDRWKRAEEMKILRTKKAVKEKINEFKLNEFDNNGYRYILFIATPYGIHSTDKSFKTKEEAREYCKKYLEDPRHSVWAKESYIIILKAQFDEVIER